MKFGFEALKGVNLNFGTISNVMSCILSASDLHGPKSGGKILLQNACTFLSKYMTSHPQNAVKLEYDEREGKVHHATGHHVPQWEYRYNPTLSLTSTIDGVDGHRHVPAALTL